MENSIGYDDKFFAQITKEGTDSAGVIVPLLLKIVRPTRVIDVGCGPGTWLKAFQDNGIEDVRGLDGHVQPEHLQIDPKLFCKADLTHVVDVKEKYDLAICLEVGEHLPKSAAPSLVLTLTTLAPLVLFSAAVPGQGGRNHVNEQWPSYWRDLFAAEGFKRLDPIRRQIWNNNKIAFWYRRNIFLYASAEAIDRSTALKEQERLAELDITYIDFLERHSTVPGVLGMLVKMSCVAVERRLRNYSSKIRRFFVGTK